MVKLWERKEDSNEAEKYLKEAEPKNPKKSKPAIPFQSNMHD